MVECKYCDEEFDSEREMHLHWGEEHEDELNSHDEEKVKKAEREKSEKKEAAMRRRKQMLGWGFAGTLGIVVIGIIAFQLLNSTSKAQQSSFKLDQQPMMGSENASVTVVEFGDYRCPFCREFETGERTGENLPERKGTFEKIKKEYIETGKVKFYFINYAFLGSGSTTAAVAGECVANQDEEEFWKYHHAVYENQGPESEQWITNDLLMNIARNNTEGLDYEKLRSCISGQKTIDKVRDDLRIGNQNQVSSTPTVFVNGETVSNWRYNGLKSAIESELN